MPVAAVLGWPLEHTLSPALHSAAYRAAGMRDWSYVAMPTRPEELAGAVGRVRSGGLAGVNLTTPHKQAVVPLLDRLAAGAGSLGAVNTVWREGDELVGDNTDIQGALWALGVQLGLRDARWGGTGSAVLAGTGGMARAAAFAYARLAAARRRQWLDPVLAVVGRDPDRTAQIAGLGGPGAHAVAWEAGAGAIASAGLLIQATTLTARGAPLPGAQEVGGGAIVLECNYGPAVAGWLAAAHSRGAHAVDGLGLLLAQAAAAFVKLTGRSPDRAAMAAAVGLAWPAEAGSAPTCAP